MTYLGTVVLVLAAAVAPLLLVLAYTQEDM